MLPRGVTSWEVGGGEVLAEMRGTLQVCPWGLGWLPTWYCHKILDLQAHPLPPHLARLLEKQRFKFHSTFVLTCSLLSKICDKEQNPTFQGLAEFQRSPHFRETLEEKGGEKKRTKKKERKKKEISCSPVIIPAEPSMAKAVHL